jgi:hypothetical protein
MNLARKDYGCPLRVYGPAGLTHALYTALPPRSARAAGRWQTLAGDWLALQFQWDHYSGSTLAMAGPHLGQRIHWRDLPPAVQVFLRQSVFGEYCPPEGAT